MCVCVGGGGWWGEGVSQYIRGLVKTQSVLVNYNSFLGFQELEILLSIFHRPLIRWFIAKAAWFPGIMRQKQKCRTLNEILDVLQSHF